MGKNTTNHRQLLAAASLAIFSPLHAARASETERPLVHSYLSNGAVVQRDLPLTLGGFAEAGEVITLLVEGQEHIAEAKESGRWSVQLPARPAGTQWSISVSTSSGKSVEINDLTFGDVWLCSGQSNMDLTVGEAANSRRVLGDAHRSDIRLLKIPRTASARPNASLPDAAQWMESTRESLRDFSSVCWHMGLELERNVDAPIGLIHAAWGGSSIEDWMSAQTLGLTGDYDAALGLLNVYGEDAERARAQLDRRSDQWTTQRDPGLERGWHRAEHNDGSWASQSLPGHWERSGIAELRSHNGTVWYRKEVTLTQAEAASGATLSLGKVDERDTVWVNGQRVGGTNSSRVERLYPIAPNVLRAGRNVIAVRVLDHKGSGGINGSARALALQLEGHADKSLAGEWRYQIGSSTRDWDGAPPMVAWAAPRGLTGMYNGMIAPLDGMRIKGLAWYQGESNASEHEQYRRLLPVWLAEWRHLFADPELPAVIVQLPAYGVLQNRPRNPEWAMMREVQSQMAASDPNVGLAVTIDLGIVDDIHPTHKKRVGERTANEALRVAYGQEMQQPALPRSADFSEGRVRIAFENVSGPLRVMGGRNILGFEVCNASDCQFASAFASGEAVTILLRDFDPATLTEIRYAWAASPVINLYDPSGLPIPPFRIKAGN